MKGAVKGSSEDGDARDIGAGSAARLRTREGTSLGGSGREKSVDQEVM